jgi:hypothetical protein
VVGVSKPSISRPQIKLNYVFDNLNDLKKILKCKSCFCTKAYIVKNIIVLSTLFGNRRDDICA